MNNTIIMMSSRPARASSSDTISIRLTYNDPKTSKRIVQSVPHLSVSSSLAQLYQLCRDIFGGDNNNKKQKQNDVELMVGFPPKPMADVDEDKTIAECGIGNQTSIMVRFVPQHRRTTAGTAKKKYDTEQKSSRGKKTKSQQPETDVARQHEQEEIQEHSEQQNEHAQQLEQLPDTSRRPRRAAAIAASETFAQVDKAMRQLEQQTSTSSSSKGGKRSAPATAATGASATSGVKRNPVPMTGAGRTLSTGASIPSTSSPRAKSVRRHGHVTPFQSEEDVATSLLSSVNSGSSGKLNATLRKVMRGAVTQSYESSKANVRVTAFQRKAYAMIPRDNVSVLGGETEDQQQQHYHGVYEIQFSKGVEGRGTFADTIEIIARAPLEDVIRAVYNSHQEEEDDPLRKTHAEEGGRNMLKPMYMSHVSPRVFWSLAYHYPHVSSIEDAMQGLCSDLDWTFLRSGRTRLLSEKARENLRQERVRRGEVADHDEEEAEEGDVKAAMNVVGAVEEAMEKMHECDAVGRRERAARAALARLSNVNAAATEREHDKEWRLDTPSEEDVDELQECILEGSRMCEINRTEMQVSVLARSLLRCTIRNWRELANADAADIFPSIHPTDCCCNGTCGIENEIERWIEEAQSRSLEEIMMEVLDRNEDAFMLLREKARTGTPKDLAMWAAIPAVLLEEILTGISTGDSDNARKERKLVESLDEFVLRKWCSRAQVALGSCEWLNWYVTPIE